MKRFPGIKKKNYMYELDRKYNIVRSNGIISTACYLEVLLPEDNWNFMDYKENIFKLFENVYISPKGLEIHVVACTFVIEEHSKESIGKKVAYAKAQKQAMNLIAQIASYIAYLKAVDVKNLKNLRKYFKSSAERELNYIKTFV